MYKTPDVVKTACMKGESRVPAEATLCYYLAFFGCMKIGCMKVVDQIHGSVVNTP